jgi:hypothetical protein
LGGSEKTPRKERNLVPPQKTDCTGKENQKYGSCKTKPSQLVASDETARNLK